MGHFYTNVTVQGATQKEIARLVAECSRWAVVTPSQNGLSVVFDRESEGQSCAVYDLAAHLSFELRCKSLAVTNHDDSVLYFRLYDTGREIDRYCSAPNYFDGQPVGPDGGNADVICQVFGAPDKREIVEEILRFDSVTDEDSDRYVFEIDRHRDLADALELPSFAVGFGYSCLASGELPQGLLIDDCYVVEGESDE